VTLTTTQFARLVETSFCIFKLNSLRFKSSGVKPEDLIFHENRYKNFRRQHEEVLQLLKYGNIIAPLAFRHHSWHHQKTAHSLRARKGDSGSSFSERRK